MAFVRQVGQLPRILPKLHLVGSLYNINKNYVVFFIILSTSPSLRPQSFVQHPVPNLYISLKATDHVTYP